MGRNRVHSERSPVPTLRIVASCTQGKRCPVPPDLRLGSISDEPLAKRLATWKTRLQWSAADCIAAIELYRGQHWTVVRDLPAVAQASGYQADLWVASAGYGLVPAAAQVRPYSATFAASKEDSVWRPNDGDRRTALRTWWNELQTLPGPVTGAPRSLTALAGAALGAVVLVIASPAYVTAMADDLEGVRARLVDPQHLVVISSRDGSLPEWLAAHLVPSEAPLSGVLGGSLGSLHARTARRILQEAEAVPLQADILVPHYAKLVRELKDVTTPARRKLCDEEVRRFIHEALTDHKALPCTAALRRLRATGRACEQRRFAGLYAEVTRTAHVT